MGGEGKLSGEEMAKYKTTKPQNQEELTWGGTMKN